MTLKFNGQHVFRTGQRLVLETKPTKPKEDEMGNAEKEIINALAEGILSRKRDEERQLAAAQPGSPPPVILAKTETQERIDAHYAKPESITVNRHTGRESYAPPPVLLAKEEK